MQDNAFLEISDIETAQKLSDRINPQGLHKVLDVLPDATVPFRNLSGWVYLDGSADRMCHGYHVRKPEYLAPIYDEIIHTANIL